MVLDNYPLTFTVHEVIFSRSHDVSFFDDVLTVPVVQERLFDVIGQLRCWNPGVLPCLFEGILSIDSLV